MNTTLTAQNENLSNYRSHYISTKTDTIRLDTLSILATSFEMKNSRNDIISSSDYTLDPIKSLLVFTQKQTSDSVLVTYRVFPLNFDKSYAKRSESIIQPESEYVMSPNTYRPFVGRDNSLGNTQLNKTGSISRGLGFGNNQDLTVNSTLSLQLNGKLTDKINVLASVTDDNIPIQPEGNTAQLQEFDQVYIQLFDDRSRLTAGDFILKTPRGYFTNYFKRAQGGSFSTRMPFEDSNKIFFTETSAAISKGKFARQIEIGQEGNQGPYRLRGNDGESFIIVLAGTERVFIDGREMQRGQENEYVIDYNTAEITFTAKQIITKDKRIAIEFQYTDANYVRTMLQTSTGMETQKYDVYMNFYTEQDSKNQPLQQDLDESDRRILNDVGDDVLNAVAPSFNVADEFNNSQVFYTIRDTLGYDSIFVVTNEDTKNLYTVNFSEVGQGNGDYIQEGFSANGRIFTWVAPDTVGLEIQRQGNYAPVRLLVAPRKTQTLMAGGNFRLSDKTVAALETGFTNYDLNTFSDNGNADNYSHGLMAKIEHAQPLGKGDNPFSLKGRLMFESIGNNFQPIEPYRSVEFNRNWNLTNEIAQENQNILTAGLGLQKGDKLNFDYAINQFTAGDIYTGIKNEVNTNLQLDGLDAWFQGSILETTGILKTQFSRHKSRILKTLWITKLGFEDEQERNRLFLSDSDSLSATAYKFYDWQVYLTNLDSSFVGYKIFYRERNDFATEFNDYSQSTNARHYGIDLSLLENPRNQFKLTVSNRELRIIDEELTSQPPESTLLGRAEHTLRLAKNAIVSNIYYELGSGLERRQEFIYVQDPTGQGAYTWVDYNSNGVKELNEFELARPEDGDRYLRVLTPTDNYQRAYSNQYTQSLNLNPAGLWATEEGFLKLVSRFSNQTAFRIQRKTRIEDGANRFNPFLESLNDSSLISQSSSIRNTVFFNRTSSKFGVDYTYNQQFSKNPLTTGFEARESVSNALRLRYNLTAKYGIILEQEVGSQRSSSDIITGRNYDIGFIKLKQTLSYQPGTDFRLSLSNDYTEKENADDLGGETANLLDIGLEMRLSKVEAGTVFAKLNVINIAYDGAVNNSLSYQLLDGLQNGRNITWGAGVQRNLGKNLQLSLNYNGRKSEEVKSIHTGNMQVRAFF